MVCYKCWTKVHIILELVMFNPCFLCLLPTYGDNVILPQQNATNYGSNIKYPAGRSNVFIAGARHFYIGHRRQRGGDHARCSRHDHLLRRAFSIRPQYL